MIKKLIENLIKIFKKCIDRVSGNILCLSKAKQSKAKQSKAKQSKAKQSKQRYLCLLEGRELFTSNLSFIERGQGLTFKLCSFSEVCL